ncbi:hypothetical protein R1sor_000149 [Riccia sorocarpa]|uniref:Uncharacterized protein n=1 Tax=Riccia sorocarpa TaxID=122646 RepID=A0ABD3GSA3_9MARC
MLAPVALQSELTEKQDELDPTNVILKKQIEAYEAFGSQKSALDIVCSELRDKLHHAEARIEEVSKSLEKSLKWLKGKCLVEFESLSMAERIESSSIKADVRRYEADRARDV